MERDDELRALWRGQKTEETTMTTMALADVMAKESKFARKIKWRNGGEQAAALLVVAIFGGLAAVGPDGMNLGARAACLLIVAAVIYVTVQIRTRGTVAPPPPPGAATREHVAYYRAQLVRQRDLLASVPRWYLAPFAPGMVLFYVSMTYEGVAGGVPFAEAMHDGAVSAAKVIAIVVVVALVNRRGAAKLTREIAALDPE